MHPLHKIKNVLERGVTMVQAGILYVLMVVVLALFSFGSLFYELSASANPEIIRHFDRLDLAVAYIFLTDFFLGVFFNTRYATRGQYIKFNWLDFVSSIPITAEATQVLRVFRLWRASKILRAAIGIWSAKQQIAIHKNQR